MHGHGFLLILLIKFYYLLKRRSVVPVRVRLSHNADFSIGGMWKKRGHFILSCYSLLHLNTLESSVTQCAKKLEMGNLNLLSLIVVLLWQNCPFQVKSCVSASRGVKFFGHLWLKLRDCWAMLSLKIISQVNKMHKIVTNCKVTEMTIHFLALS